MSLNVNKMFQSVVDERKLTIMDFAIVTDNAVNTLDAAQLDNLT